MFVLFSNRLGCLASLAVSVIVSVLMIVLLRACTGGRVW